MADPRWFHAFAEQSAEAIGSAPAFLITIGVTGAWLVVGPFVGFSDTWQLTLTTSYTVATQLIVTLIQHTQNLSDAEARAHYHRSQLAYDDLCTWRDEMRAWQAEAMAILKRLQPAA